mgnify:CR=1 FL=1
MPCRVKHQNKKNGITYVYESQSYWDKEKKQPRNKRICIGKINPNDGKFIPSKRFSSPSTLPITASAQVIGPCLILDAIVDRLPLKALLKACFPKQHHALLTMAYYLVAQGGPLSHCQAWCKSHAPDIHSIVSSQRISDLLST